MNDEKKHELLLSSVLEIVATTPPDGMILVKHANVLVEALTRLRVFLTTIEKERDEAIRSAHQIARKQWWRVRVEGSPPDSGFLVLVVGGRIAAYTTPGKYLLAIGDRWDDTRKKLESIDACGFTCTMETL